MPAIESRAGAVTVPDPDMIDNAVVEALLENVLVAPPRKVVVPKADKPVNVPEIVCAVDDPLKYRLAAGSLELVKIAPLLEKLPETLN